MAQTEVVPTKFPEQDVIMMDRLIQKGAFISRSDLIRESVRKSILMKKKEMQRSDFELMAKQMKEKGDFNSLEGKVLSKLFLDGCEKPLKEKDFNAAEQKTIRKLLRHPFNILKKKADELILTENGIRVARGYLKGLAYSKAS